VFVTVCMFFVVFTAQVIRTASSPSTSAASA
jgi:hypothetical protein